MADIRRQKAPGLRIPVHPGAADPVGQQERDWDTKSAILVGGSLDSARTGPKSSPASCWRANAAVGRRLHHSPSAPDREATHPHHLGVLTTCGTPPGTSKVLVPLPLFRRKPCPTLPGRVVVCMEPILPVMNAGPLDVSNACPVSELCGAEPASDALAWLAEPTSVATANASIHDLRALDL